MLFWGPKIEVPRWANPGLRQSRHVARRDTSGHVRGTPIVGRLGLAELINGNLWGESTTTGAGELSSISMNKHRTGIAGVATGAKSKALSHMTGCPMAQSLVTSRRRRRVPETAHRGPQSPGGAQRHDLRHQWPNTAPTPASTTAAMTSWWSSRSRRPTSSSQPSTSSVVTSER